MKRKPYPKYKASRVDWLGDIPEHWEVKRLDFIARVKARLGWKGLKADEYVDEGYIFLSTPNIKGEGDIDFSNVNYITAERYLESPEIMLSLGDVILAKDGSTLGTVNVVRELPAPATVNSSLAVVRPLRFVSSGFLFRWISSCYIQESIAKMKDGQGVPHLFQSDIRKFCVVVPTASEQKAIADYLDLETGRIDTLIEKKQRLIELLKEKRTALISRAVTKGLNPTVKMKPSGVDWLGEVPEHWEVVRLKRIVAIPITDGPHETPEILDEGIPFISAEAISQGQIDFSKKRGLISIEDDLKYSKKYKPRRDDIFMIKSGATTGNLAMVDTDEDFNIWSPLAVVRVHKQKANARFVLSAMSSREFQTSVQLYWSFGTQQNIGMNVIENLVVPLPPLPEQETIATFLDRETTRIDALMAKVEVAIERLKEYRTAFISAAVTGKIDVREDSC